MRNISFRSTSSFFTFMGLLLRLRQEICFRTATNWFLIYFGTPLKILQEKHPCPKKSLQSIFVHENLWIYNLHRKVISLAFFRISFRNLVAGIFHWWFLEFKIDKDNTRVGRISVFSIGDTERLFKPSNTWTPLHLFV